LLELGQDPEQVVELAAGDTIDFMCSARHLGYNVRLVAFEATISLSGVVESLDCERLTQSETLLTWELPSPVDSLRILRDGVELAVLDPTDTSYTDAATPERAHTYTVEATLGLRNEGPSCTLEDPTFGAISDLLCDRPGDGETVTVSWTNNGPGYDTLSIQIDPNDPVPGELIALDPATTQFVDENVPSGPRTYRIAATWENGGTGGVSCSPDDPRLVPPSDLICVRDPNAVADDDVDLTWVNNGTGYDSVHIFLNDVEIAVLAADATEYLDTVPPGDADFEVKYTARVLSPGPTCRLSDPDFPNGTRWVFEELFPQSLDESTNPVGVFTFGGYTGITNTNPYPLPTPTELPIEFFVPFDTVGNPAGLATWSSSGQFPDAFGVIALRPADTATVWNPAWFGGPHWEIGMINLQCSTWQSPTVRVTIPEDGNYFINASYENRNAGNVPQPAGAPTDIRVFVRRDGELDESISVLSRTVDVPGTGDVEVPVTVAGFQSELRVALGEPQIPDPRLSITDQDIIDGVATEQDRAEGRANNRFFRWPQDLNRPDLNQGDGGGVGTSLPFSAGDTLEFMACPREGSDYQHVTAFQLTVQLALESVTPTGGCCDEDGNCTVAEQADCVAGGGTYQGNGTLCDTVTCPVDTGACCAAGGCQELSEEDCTAADGTYNGDGTVCLADTCGTPFRRGDHDGSGLVDITDPLNLLGFLFLGQTPPICEDASDGDNSGALDISDALNLLGFLFLGSFPLNETLPGPANCGLDPDFEIDPDGDGPLPVQPAESLGCDTYPSAVGLACP
jgi:hypothetical protein